MQTQNLYDESNKIFLECQMTPQCVTSVQLEMFVHLCKFEACMLQYPHGIDLIF